jgi:hypothetical protein
MKLDNVGADALDGLLRQFWRSIDEQQHDFETWRCLRAQGCGLLKADMARALIKMHKANMRRAVLCSGADAFGRGEPADFDLGSQTEIFIR